jgi:hypothetical protein
LSTDLKTKEFYKIQGHSKKIRVFQNPYGRPGDRAKIREKPGKYGRMDSPHYDDFYTQHLWLENERDDVVMMVFYAAIRPELEDDLVNAIDKAILEIDFEKIFKEIEEKMK